MGGGTNHRSGLYDMILIKENHIAVAGGIRQAVSLAKEKRSEGVLIEVEVRDLNEMSEALKADPDIILLDNFSVSQLQEAARKAGGQVLLEASGNVSLENIESIGATGVHRISVGSLTHSARSFDLSMMVELVCC